MAIVINSKFTPFTFDEMLKPALMAHQMHQDLEDQYTELATKANIWEGMANEQTDPEAYKMYKTYSDDLKKQADILASQGLTPTSRKALSQMKARYASEITPIEQAYNAKKEANKYRDTVRSKDNSAIFRKPKYTSLDYFLKGNEADNTYISGKDVMTKMAAKAEATGQAVYKQLIAEGKSPIEALNEIRNGKNAIMQQLYNDDKESLGYNSLDTDSQNILDSYINTGMSQALNKVIDSEFMNATQLDASKRAWEQIYKANRQYDLNMAKHNLEMAEAGYKYNEDTKQYVPDETSPVWTRDKEGNLVKDANTKNTNTTTKGPMLSTAVLINKNGRSRNMATEDVPEGWEVTIDSIGNMTYENEKGEMEDISESDKKRIENTIKNGDYENYSIRITKKGEITIIPNDIKTLNASSSANFDNI